jgi:hypothetical protein
MQAVFSVGPLREYMTRQTVFCSESKCSAVQLRVQLWSVNQQVTEAKESPLLKFFLVKILRTAVAKKRLVEID